MAASPYRTTQFPGQGPPPSSESGPVATVGKAVLGLGCGCGAGLALMFFLLMAWIVTLPEGGAMPGAQLRPESLEYLRDQGLIERDELVVYYYDYTMRMTDDESCFFTDRRVVYHRGDQVNEIALENIEDIRTWEDFGQIIEVQSTDGRYLKCEIPALNDGEAFYAALQSAWERQRLELAQ